MKKLLLVFMILVLMVGCTPETDGEDERSQEERSQEENFDNDSDAKPVIYLYPESKITVDVELNYKGVLEYTYPEYDNGWRVIAEPSGRLVNIDDGREYSYLFWEGDIARQWEFEEGFIVAQDELVDFFIEKLSFMGLEAKEYNEFIVYWLPILGENEYTWIYFANEEYTDTAELKINPEPDSVLRVFMVAKGIDEKIEVEEQNLNAFQRVGFTVIEWGGTVIED